MKTFFLCKFDKSRQRFLILVFSIVLLATPSLTGCNQSQNDSANRKQVSTSDPELSTLPVTAKAPTRIESRDPNKDEIRIPPSNANSLHLAELQSEQDDATDVPLQTAPTRIPILMYHSISDRPKNTLCVSPERFALEMKHLYDAHYHPVTFHDLENAWLHHEKIASKPILITFDDGYKDNYTAAYPVLKRYHFHATIFIITHTVGNRSSLSWDEIRQMDDEGLITFGSHTVDHLDLSQMSNQQQQNQLVQSKQILEQQLGHPVDSFCYPSGRYNTTTVRLVQQAGYTFAVTTHPGYAAMTQGQWTLDRVRVSGDETDQTFAQLFS